MRARLHLRPVTWVVGKALGIMPIGAAVVVSDWLMGGRAFERLCAAGLGGFAERLLLHRLSVPPAGAEFEGVILIAGFPKVGKSIVARAVADSLGMRVLSTDRIAKNCFLGRDSNRESSLREVLSRICEQSRGLVLEGRHLVKVDESDNPNRPAVLSLAFDTSALSNGDVSVFAIGCCDCSAEAWESALREYGGWINRKGDDFIQRFARTRSERSKQMREFSRNSGVEYFEIPREGFAEAVERAAAAIVAKVRI